MAQEVVLAAQKDPAGDRVVLIVDGKLIDLTSLLRGSVKYDPTTNEHRVVLECIVC